MIVVLTNTGSDQSLKPQYIFSTWNQRKMQNIPPFSRGDIMNEQAYGIVRFYKEIFSKVKP